MTNPHVHVFILSRRGQGKEQVRKAFAQDREGEPTPYGLNSTARSDWVIEYSKDRPHSRLSAAFFKRFEFDFFHAFDNLKALRRADVIWTILEWEWLGIALLQRLHLMPRRPVIANSVWLADKWETHSRAKRAFLKWLMLPHFDFTLHSRRSLNYLKTKLADHNWRISEFGISTQAFPLTPPRGYRKRDGPINVYSIGNDGTRDWSTILAAFGNDQRFAVKIVCAWLDLATTKGFSNVECPREVTISQQREFYRKADVVVISMKENLYSGITVALEASAMGVPIIVTDTGGVATYFDDDEVVFVPVGNAEALRTAVLEAPSSELFARARKAQARFATHGYTADAMVERYIASTELLLSGELAGNRRSATAVRDITSA